MPNVHLDFETKSTTDLKAQGLYRYCEDQNTDIMCFSYAFGDEAPQRWRPGFPAPDRLLRHIAGGGRVVAHNAAFERNVWNKVLLPKYGPHWPWLLIEQQDCTMARAAIIGHPQQLDALCNVLQTNNRKDRLGGSLIQKYCKPRRILADGTIVWWDDENDLLLIYDYCDKDVMTERDVDNQIPPMTEYQRQMWELDQRINERGIPIDIRAATVCTVITEIAKKDADKLMREITNRKVPRCSSDKKMVAWLNECGLKTDAVNKGVMDNIIFQSYLVDNKNIQSALALRKEARKTSTSKYKKMLESVCMDGRVRGALNFHGAATGRWAGRLFQPQNLPRNDYEENGHLIEKFHSYIERGQTASWIHEYLAFIEGPSKPLSFLSKALRSAIKAPEGKKFIGGDYSNIEGRVNAWLAGEQWKLQAFRDFDEGKGEDLYNLMYANSFGINVKDVTKSQRQIGKVEELAGGYQGSVGAFISMGEVYGLSVFDLSEAVYPATSKQEWEEVRQEYEKSKALKRYMFDLREKEWIALKVLVNLYRRNNPNIVQSWWDYQDAVVEAVCCPNTFIPAAKGKVHYYYDGRCLWCILPSGRMLCYPSPRLKEETQTAINKNGEEYTYVKRSVITWGIDSETKKWVEYVLYGGLLCENNTQAISADVMIQAGMFNAEARGYPLVLTVHDELLALVDNTPLLNHKEFKSIMLTPLLWAEGLPLAAKTWEDVRYIK